MSAQRLEHHTETPNGAMPGVTQRSGAIESGLAELVLNDNGMIRECSRTCGKLLGCLPTEMIWRPISAFLPQLASIPLMLGRQINPRLRFLSRIGQPFEVVGVGDIRFIGEIFVNDVENLGRHSLHLIICPIRKNGSDIDCMPV